MNKSFDTRSHMRRGRENYSEKPQKKYNAVWNPSAARPFMFNLMNPALLGKQQTQNEIELRVT